MNEAEQDQTTKIRMLLLQCNSHQRLEQLLALTEKVSDAVFWNVFASDWPECDQTWLYQGVLLHVLKRRAGPEFRVSEIGTAKNQSFFASLGDPTTVYRGCWRERISGLSWTTDIDVARNFARKHREMGVPDPVVARAKIPKGCIFAAFQDRTESEVLLDPEMLQDLEITPFKGSFSGQE